VGREGGKNKGKRDGKNRHQHCSKGGGQTRKISTEKGEKQKMGGKRGKRANTRMGTNSALCRRDSAGKEKKKKKTKKKGKGKKGDKQGQTTASVIRKQKKKQG